MFWKKNKKLLISQFHKLDNIIFFEKTKMFSLSIFHWICFLNAMFGRKVENILNKKNSRWVQMQ
jgi:hypothetical protein